MPVQSHGGGWRARKKHAGQWFVGPVRESVQLAEEDARKFDEPHHVQLLNHNLPPRLLVTVARVNFVDVQLGRQVSMQMVLKYCVYDIFPRKSKLAR